MPTGHLPSPHRPRGLPTVLLMLGLAASCRAQNPVFSASVGLRDGGMQPEVAPDAEGDLPVAPALDTAEPLPDTQPEPVDALIVADTSRDISPDISPDVLPVVSPDAAPDLPAEPPAADLLTGLIGYWTMDDGSGNRAADRSGLGHHGTLEGLDPATAWVGGYFGGALYVNQNEMAGVRVVPSRSLDGMQRFTVAAWVYREEVGRFGSVMSRQISGTNNDIFGLTFSNNELSIYVPPINGVTTVARSPLPFPVKKWVHVAATYDGDTVHLYQGGVLQASQPARVTLPSSLEPIYLGTNKNSTLVPEPLRGRLDEVLIYDRALLPSEISALAAGARPQVAP